MAQKITRLCRPEPAHGACWVTRSRSLPLGWGPRGLPVEATWGLLRKNGLQHYEPAAGAHRPEFVPDGKPADFAEQVFAGGNHG